MSVRNGQVIAGLIKNGFESRTQLNLASAGSPLLRSMAQNFFLT